MILWFGKKKKADELKAAGAAMEAPELSAEDFAAKQAAEAEKAEIERIVAEANKAWEDRQAREAERTRFDDRSLAVLQFIINRDTIDSKVVGDLCAHRERPGDE